LRYLQLKKSPPGLLTARETGPAWAPVEIMNTMPV
jgi:hypothetical protein